MEYSIERVRALAQIARIALTKDEETALCRSLGALHGIAQILDSAPIDATVDDPFSNAVPLSAWREDLAAEWEGYTAWAEAAASEDGFFTVPRVLEE